MTIPTFARALACLCLLALPAAPAAAAQSSTTLGGSRPVATDSELVQAAGAALAEQVGGELASVDAASAGGLTYRLEITLADGARWSGVLLARPDRSFTVSGQPVQLSGGEETDTGTNDGSDTSGDDE
jgi:hypothetical protein